MTLADGADRELAKGDFIIGPLHGVPFTTKINTDQKGCATTNGVAAFASLIAHEDSPVDRQSAPGGRDRDRPHQRPGILLALVHRQ